jgi:Site-specific recombinase XerD
MAGKFKKNKDGYYRTSFVVGKTPDGSPKRVTVRGKTKREFEEKLDEAKRLHARGLSLGNMTVYEWSVRWMKVYKTNASDMQKEHYQAKLNNDILPVIGGMRIRDVRASHLQEMLNAYSGQKEGTVKKVRVAIKQLFADAETEGITERNPAARLELPEMGNAPRRPLTLEECNIVSEVAKTHPRGAYVLTMLYCGLRRGECLALKVSDIDFKRKRLNVEKSWSLRKNTGTEKKPTTAAGIREIPIPERLLPVLEKACSNKPGDGILFPKADGKQATKQACRLWWNSFKRQCHIAAGAKLYRNAVVVDTSPFGDELTPHYLRHTYATDLYIAGVDENARKHFLGRSSDDATDTFAKMTDIAFDRAAKLIDDYYAKKSVSISKNQA